MVSLNSHEFLEIDEGLACLGSDIVDIHAGPREFPLREVYVSTFEISKYPTTRSQFANFLISARLPLPSGWSDTDENGWPRALEAEGDFPMTQVSWELANAYCDWLSVTSGEPVVLPTEAEWEKAARGGDDRIWPWGDEFDANRCNSAESGRDGFCPIQEYAEGASPYGCMHMAGGVWEWCEDYHHPFSHQSIASVDPVNLTPARQRVVKGGSAYCTKEIVRPAGRDWTNSINQGGGDDGFRVAIRRWRPAPRGRRR